MVHASHLATPVLSSWLGEVAAALLQVQWPPSNVTPADATQPGGTRRSHTHSPWAPTAVSICQRWNNSFPVVPPGTPDAPLHDPSPLRVASIDRAPLRNRPLWSSWVTPHIQARHSLHSTELSLHLGNPATAANTYHPLPCSQHSVSLYTKSTRCRFSNPPATALTEGSEEVARHAAPSARGHDGIS